MECKETFEDIVSVWPFAQGEIEYRVPYLVRKRVLTTDDLGLTDGATIGSLLQGKPCYTIGEDWQSDHSVEIEERKNVLKSTTKSAKYGRSFEISLTLQVIYNNVQSVSLMDSLERTPHDFLLLLASGDYLLLRTDYSTYLCKSEEQFGESYTQKLTITAECYNGIQRISV